MDLPILIASAAEAQPHSALEIVADLVGKIAWPIAVLAIGLALRRPIGLFLKSVGERATEISIAGWATIKLPTMTQAPVTDELSAFRAEGAPTLLYNSAKRTLFALFQDRTRKEYVVVNIGRGEQWLTSRLYISALMLERMIGLKSVVFVAAGVDTETKFLGVARPGTVRWAVARAQPWLEVAFANAYQMAITNWAAPAVTDESGGMDPALAESLVSTFLTNIQMAPAAPIIPPAAGALPPLNPLDWATLGESQEHASWIDKSWFDYALKDYVWNDSVRTNDDGTAEVRAVVQCTAPFVARIKPNGEFVALIDRTAFLEKVATRVTTPLKTAD